MGWGWGWKWDEVILLCDEKLRVRLESVWVSTELRRCEFKRSMQSERPGQSENNFVFSRFARVLLLVTVHVQTVPGVAPSAPTPSGF